MSFFKKNKKDNYNDDYEYMDDYIDDYNYNDYYNNNYNNNNYGNNYNNYYNENDYNYNSEDEKRMEKKRNSFISKTRRKLKRKKLEEYSYSTGYEDERVYYNENGEEVIIRKELNYKTMLSFTILFFYFLFLIIGFVGTTFENGYIPQIINSQTRSERITYNKVLKEIEFLEEIDSFNGIEELQELYKTGNFQSRIPPLKKSLKEVTNKIEDMKNSAYKVKEKDYVNVEMIDMIKDLLETKKQTLTLTIRFYESMSGYSSTNNALQKSQDELLNQYQIYNNKLANYKMRLEQIKAYELKLEK